MQRINFFVNLSAFLITISIGLLLPSKAFASTIFLDNFNDNSLDLNNWEVKNFAVEESGSNSPFGELSLDEVNSELKIAGIGTIDTVILDDQIVGNIGKSLIYKKALELDSKTLIETDVRLAGGDEGFGLTLTIEFDYDNRILFNLQWFGDGSRRAQFVFDEMDEIRCPINNESAGCGTFIYNFQNNQTLKLKIDFDPSNNKATAYINGDQIAWGNYLGNVSDANIGIAATVRNVGQVVDVRFDNFAINDVSNNGTMLEFTDLKQYSPPWGDMKYDFASSWYPSNPAISRWGCAITSAAMVLNYHGGNITPETLNNWLKNNNGYTRNGGVLWPAVSKFSKDDPNIPSLEFLYKNYSDDLFKTEIRENRPPILKLATNVGNHFIVGKGFTDLDNIISDPGHHTNSTVFHVNSYWGNTLKLGQFKPSNTDLAYIVLLINDGFNIKFYDNEGEIANPDYYHQERPMLDPENPTNLSNVATLNAFYYPKPTSGVYRIEVVGYGNYQLDSYAFSEEGHSKQLSIMSSTDHTQTKVYLLEFNKGNANATEIFEVSFDALLANWEVGYKNGKVKNVGLFTSTKEIISIAKKLYESGKINVAQALLETTSNILTHATSKQIDLEYSQDFKSKINLFIQQTF